MRMSERSDVGARLPGDVVAAARLRQKLGAKLEVPTPDWIQILAAPSNEEQLRQVMAEHTARLQTSLDRRKKRLWIDIATAAAFFVVGLVVALVPERSDSDFSWLGLILSVAVIVAVVATILLFSRGSKRSSDREMQIIARQYEEVLRSMEILKQVHEVSRSQSHNRYSEE